MSLSKIFKSYFKATYSFIIPENFAPRAISHERDARFSSLRGRKISLAHLLATPLKALGKIALIVVVSLTTPLARSIINARNKKYLKALRIIVLSPITVPLDFAGAVTVSLIALTTNVVLGILGATIYPRAMVNGSAHEDEEVHPYTMNIFGVK